MLEELVKRLRELPHLLFVQLHGHEDVVYQAANAIEELSKQIKAVQCVNIGDLECDSNQLCTCMGIVRKRLEEDEKKPRWIPVTERLPEQGKRYLVIRYDYVTNTPFVDILWHDAHDLWWNRLYKGQYAVTHWMPLPEPPKEET